MTRPAASQLDKALAYIRLRNPQGARNVRRSIEAALDLLLHQPYAGAVTVRPGIRRVMALPYPYAITYRVIADEIVILGIRHAARQPHP